MCLSQSDDEDNKQIQKSTLKVLIVKSFLKTL